MKIRGAFFLATRLNEKQKICLFVCEVFFARQFSGDQERLSVMMPDIAGGYIFKKGYTCE